MGLIDREDTLNNLPDDLPYKASVRRVLLQAPNVPVVHCNYCGISFIGVANSKGYMYKYCPVCGKRLDGETE